MANARSAVDRRLAVEQSEEPRRPRGDEESENEVQLLMTERKQAHIAAEEHRVVEYRKEDSNCNARPTRHPMPPGSKARVRERRRRVSAARPDR